MISDACTNRNFGHFRSVSNDYCIFYNKVISPILQ